jgi:hypothetical protein
MSEREMTAKIIPVRFGHQHIAFKPKPAKPSYTFSRSTLETIAIALAFVCGMVIGWAL